jgi:type IV pilus assembly protein PilM
VLTKKKFIFRFSETHLDIGIISKSSKSIKLKEVTSFTPDKNFDIRDGEYNKEENISLVKDYLRKKSVKNKKVSVILAQEGIITRLIETPVMKKKDIDSFISNNIADYFTLNIDDYFFDYMVVSLNRLKEKRFSILLVAVPKTRLIAIRDFIKSCSLDLDTVTIYPACIANLFQNQRNISAAVLDIGLPQSNITILEEGNIFLYSRITLEDYDNKAEVYKEFLEIIGYFLNFYSTRHFGKPVDIIYLTGENCSDINLQDLVKEQFGIEVKGGLKENELGISTSKSADINSNIDMLGLSIKTKGVYSKTIDFSRMLEGKMPINIDRTVLKFAGVLIALTILCSVLPAVYIESRLLTFRQGKLKTEISSLEPIERQYTELENFKIRYEKKQSYLKNIESKDYDYTMYLDALRKGLPSDAAVSSLRVSRDTINIVLKLGGNTLDKIKLVIAINNMDLFEPLEIDSIRLDNTDLTANFTLKIKKPL